MSEVKIYTLVMGEKEILNFKHGEEQRLGQFVKYKDYAALETKCAALVAESTRLKSAVTQQIELRAVIKKAGRPPHADFWVQSICEAEENVKRALEETPATNAFLAEIHAQGVEMFADHLLCSDLDDTIRDFADQLRKGGNQ